MRLSCLLLLLIPFTFVNAKEVEKDTIVTVRPSDAKMNKQQISQFFGISSASGATGISMNKVVIPAGGSAVAHSHSGYESAIYLVQGHVKTLYGKDLKKSVENYAGDFIFIPPNVLHQPINMSKTESAIAIVARNDPNEQEHVILHDKPIDELNK